ncbi:hypothetical protein Tco_1362640 [Tanacetum coccineum]
MLLAMKDEAGSNLNNEENDFMLDTSYGEETMEELTAAVMLMARIQPADGNAETVPSYDAKAVSEVNASSKLKRLFNSTYLEDIVDLEEKLSSHDRIVYKIAGLGYKNPEHLKKAIAAQPKMYDGEKLHSTKLVIDSPDSEETLEDAKDSRPKIRNKMVQINYAKLNAIYETFVPQKDFSVEQTYFSLPSTSSNGSESKAVTSNLPIPKMPKESKLLKMFDTLGVAINGLRTRIDNTLLKDRQRRWILKELKEEFIEEVHEMLNIFESMEQKVDEKSSKENILQTEIDRLLEVSLTSEIQNYVLISIESIFVEKQKNEMLKDKLVKSSSDSKDIQANLLKRIKILKNDFKRSQAQSIDFELKLQHQKEKMTCDVSWKSKLSTLNDENTQHQKEVDELIEHVNQKTYAYADVRAQNQDLLMTISELKDKLRTIEKGKHVNTKFDKSETLGKLVRVTPFNKNLGNKAKNVSNTEVKAYTSKPVTSHPTPKSEQSQKQDLFLDQFEF